MIDLYYFYYHRLRLIVQKLFNVCTQRMLTRATIYRFIMIGKSVKPQFTSRQKIKIWNYLLVQVFVKFPK